MPSRRPTGAPLNLGQEVQLCQAVSGANGLPPKRGCCTEGESLGGASGAWCGWEQLYRNPVATKQALPLGKSVGRFSNLLARSAPAFRDLRATVAHRHQDTAGDFQARVETRRRPDRHDRVKLLLRQVPIRVEQIDECSPMLAEEWSRLFECGGRGTRHSAKIEQVARIALVATVPHLFLR